jgi:hypothetical protein
MRERWREGGGGDWRGKWSKYVRLAVLIHSVRRRKGYGVKGERLKYSTTVLIL